MFVCSKQINSSSSSRGNLLSFFCLDVAQGHMKGAPNETRTAAAEHAPNINCLRRKDTGKTIHKLDNI